MKRCTRIGIAFAMTVAGGCAPPADPLAVIGDYETLSDRHDVDALVRLYAEDARLDFGPMGVLEGHDAIRAIHEYDRALDSQLEFDECRVVDSTVTCRTVERNAWLDVAGINQLVYARSAITLNEAGLIQRIEAELTPESAAAMGGALAQFDAWARANQPDAYAGLFRPDGSFDYGYDAGVKVLALLRQWRPDGGQQAQ